MNEPPPVGPYEAAMWRLAQLMRTDPTKGSPDGEELLMLVGVAEFYERRLYPEFFITPAKMRTPHEPTCLVYAWSELLRARELALIGIDRRGLCTCSATEKS